MSRNAQEEYEEEVEYEELEEDEEVEEEDDDYDDDDDDDDEEEEGEEEEGRIFQTQLERDNYEKSITRNYREINNMMLRKYWCFCHFQQQGLTITEQRAEVARLGGLKIVQTNLKTIDSLFSETSKVGTINKNIQTYDAKSLSNVSDLAEISIRNMKIGKSAQHIDVNDFLRKTKSFLLQDSLNSDDQVSLLSGQDGNAEIEQLRQSGQAITDEALREIEANKQRREALIDSRLDFDDFNFLKLGSLFMGLGYRAAFPDFLKGPLTIEKKSRIVKRRIKDDFSTGDAVTADKPNITNMAEKQDDTAVAVRKVFQQLHDKQSGEPINVYKFFINPKSFCQSVENMFYTSFLVRDGRVMLKKTGDFWDIIEVPMKKLDYDTLKNSPIDHYIFQLSFPKWKELIQDLNITNSFLEERNY